MKNIINKALEENRLGYKNMTHHGQSCNGGTLDNRPYYPKNGKPGKWLPEIDDISECLRGYHVTLDPLAWAGNQVALIETRTPITQHNKQVVSTYRILKILQPEDCINIRLWVRINFPFFRHADLRHADLRHANLRDANLWDANLRDADLRDANLRNANLRHANLWNADLRHANLWNADLRHANLRDANLRDADLRDANLRDANLRNADLRDADLRDADLRHADLSNADLSNAERFKSDPEITGWNLENGILVKDYAIT